MFILLLLVLGLSMPMIAEAQIACSNLGGGTTYCSSSSGSTSITELGHGMGIITQQGRDGSSSMEPYSIIGRDRHRSGGIEPLERLDRLPSSSSYDDGYRSSVPTPIYGGSRSVDDPLGLDR
jgi:hypothetical protein